MNSLGKKDIENILYSVADKLKLDEHVLLDVWGDCHKLYFEKLGVTLTSKSRMFVEENECKCTFAGCPKNVLKPQYINGKLLCSLHYQQAIKKAKRSITKMCCHISSSKSAFNCNNIDGENAKINKHCTSKALPDSLFCKRHQKKQFSLPSVTSVIPSVHVKV
jgi:hypothetical protein